MLFPSEEKNRCVKIVVTGNHKETLREQSYYRLLSKRNISWSMLVQFYGNVETNRGEGAVFELVRDSTATSQKLWISTYPPRMNQPLIIKIYQSYSLC